MIRYRNGVFTGRGASLLDGYMEDLATDRIYRLMIAQRMRHHGEGAPDLGPGLPPHTPALIARIFDEELERLVSELPKGKDPGSADTLRRAREWSESSIVRGDFDPV